MRFEGKCFDRGGDEISRMEGYCPRCNAPWGYEVNTKTGLANCWLAANCKTKEKCIREAMGGYIFEETPNK